jgi:hypothetical protein
VKSASVSDGPAVGNPLTFYSSDYFEARERFREAARQTGATLHSHALSAEAPNRERLWIDAAVLGPTDARSALVLSSGLHGVEAVFGAAVILSWLSFWDKFVPVGLRVVILHSLNPYGQVYRRRVNEDNVDLNRNFLPEGEAYAGSPPLYSRIDRYINPRKSPAKWDAWALTLGMIATRYGKRRLFETIPVGQYEFPRGLFFGGHGPCESTKYVQRWLPEFLGDAQNVLHVDLHTGLGKRGDVGLFFDRVASDPQSAWFDPWKNLCHFQPTPGAATPHKPTPYKTRGSFDLWTQKTFADRTYRFATLEVGTCTSYRILEALRAENQAFFYGGGSPKFAWAQDRMAQCFAPSEPAWRAKSLVKVNNLLWEMTNSLRNGS